MALFLSVILLFPRLMRADSCHSDRNKDHRPRVSCVGMSLSAVPASIESSTEVLILSQNLFVSLNWDAYVGFPGLQELDLSQNRISALEGSGTTLANLSVLHLSNNLLVSVGERAFVSVPQLRELYLRRNQLSSLHGRSFIGLPILEVLDISRNKLTVLPPDLLSQISSTALKTLDLEDNQITLMPDNWFSSKPELPYVFLSKNPWVCFCNVGYMQVYLEDQAHNVYIHTNPDSANPIQDLENNVESVTCASPPSLANRPIVDLAEEEYCDPTLTSNAPALPIRYGDTYTSMDIPSHTESTTTVNPWTTRFTTRITTTPSPTTIDLGPTSSTTIGTTQTTSAFVQKTLTTSDTIDIKFEHVFTTPVTVLASTLPGTIMLWTRRWIVSLKESWTFQHVWTETWISPHNQSFWWSDSTTNYPKTFSERSISTWTTFLLPDNSKSSEGPTTTTTSPTIPTLTFTDFTLTKNNQLSVHQAHVNAGARIWCAWLFSGLFLLCFLSALSSCLLALGLLWIYFTVYHPLTKRVNKVVDAHTNLLDYQEKCNSEELSGYREWLATMNSSGGVQATFRSVLFITKGGEGLSVEETEKQEKKAKNEQRGKKKKERENIEGEKAEAATFASAEHRITDVETGVAVVKQRNQRDRERRDGMESKEVFRKTLYRVFSREEEIKGWKEVEEHWEVECGTEEEGKPRDSRRRISVMGRAGVQRKSHYSLILREEKVKGECGAQERGLEWLVGEWEMGEIRDGMNDERASFLGGIGEEGPPVKATSSKEDM